MTFNPSKFNFPYIQVQDEKTIELMSVARTGYESLLQYFTKVPTWAYYSMSQCEPRGARELEKAAEHLEISLGYLIKALAVTSPDANRPVEESTFYETVRDSVEQATAESQVAEGIVEGTGVEHNDGAAMATTEQINAALGDIDTLAGMQATVEAVVSGDTALTFEEHTGQETTLSTGEVVRPVDYAVPPSYNSPVNFEGGSRFA